MANTQLLQSKYQSLPATGPWPSVSGTRFLSPTSMDLDGDGCDEVIALSPLCVGLTSAYLGVLSYFDDTALSSSFEAGQLEQLVASSTLPFDPSQNAYPVNIRAAGVNDIMIFDPNTLSISLYGWSNNALSNVWTTVNTVYGTANWSLAPQNTFLMGDIDGDGLQEIIALGYSNSFPVDIPMALSVMKWINDSDIRVIWSAPNNTIPSSVYTPWSVASRNQFVIADIDGDGRDEIVAYDGDVSIGLFRWDSTADALTYFWMTSDDVYSVTEGVANWPIAADNRFCAGDVNGDGKAEIVASSSSALAAFEFNGSDLRVIGVNSGFIPSSTGGTTWMIGAQDIHLPGNFEAASYDTIVVGNLPGSWLGVLNWDASSAGFVVDQIDNLSVGSSGPTWTLDPENTFTIADVDGDGIDELVAQDDTNGALGYLKSSGGVLAPVWVYAAQPGGSPLAGWGPGVIATAPATAFGAWPGSQAQIYANTSSSLTQLSSQTTDIRSYYVNENDYVNMGSYASDLATAYSQLNQSSPTYYWTWMDNPDFSIDDMNTVLLTLQAEMLAVSSVWIFYSDTTALLNSMLTQQQTDLGTVGSNLGLASDNATSGSYWGGQVMDAVLWGFAAEIAPFALEFSILASLFGSLLGSVNGDTAQSVAYNDLNAQLATNNQNAQQSLDNLLYDASTSAGILTDPIRLPVLGRYLAGAGLWTTESKADLVAASSNYNRITFYQQLLPQVFQIYQFNGLISLDLQDVGAGAQAPDNAAYIVVNQTSSNVYAMANDLYGQWMQVGFPSTALTDDLETNLGFSQQSIFTGASSLNVGVSVQNYDGSNQECVVYTTSDTPNDVWVTIYDFWGEGLCSGMVSAGTTATWSGHCLWSNTYHVRGEVKDQNGNTIADTRIKIYPTNDGGYGNYAVAMEWGGGDEFYWEALN